MTASLQPPVLPPLPADVRDALPERTPAPPWPCRVRATAWWHRARPQARAVLPPGVRPGLPVTVGALIEYLDTPVGPYREVLACPLLLRGGSLVHTTVPFIAVDSVPSIAGGRQHWALPKVLAAFTHADGTTTADGGGWRLVARTSPLGPALPVAARFSTTQDGVRRATSSVRARGRLARVEVQGEGLPAWLVPGRHLGVVLADARLTVGPAR